MWQTSKQSAGLFYFPPRRARPLPPRCAPIAAPLGPAAVADAAPRHAGLRPRLPHQSGVSPSRRPPPSHAPPQVLGAAAVAVATGPGKGSATGASRVQQTARLAPPLPHLSAPGPPTRLAHSPGRARSAAALLPLPTLLRPPRLPALLRPPTAFPRPRSPAHRSSCSLSLSPSRPGCIHSAAPTPGGRALEPRSAGAPELRNQPHSQCLPRRGASQAWPLALSSPRRGLSFSAVCFVFGPEQVALHQFASWARCAAAPSGCSSWHASLLASNRSAVRWAAPGLQLSAEHSCAASGTCFFTVLLHTLTLLGPTRKKRSLLA